MSFLKKLLVTVLCELHIRNAFFGVRIQLIIIGPVLFGAVVCAGAVAEAEADGLLEGLPDGDALDDGEAVVLLDVALPEPEPVDELLVADGDAAAGEYTMSSSLWNV